MELLSSWCCAAAFFSACDTMLLQEVAGGKISVQSDYALNTRYVWVLNMTAESFIQINAQKQMHVD
jgi:hypothetical protein